MEEKMSRSELVGFIRLGSVAGYLFLISCASTHGSDQAAAYSGQSSPIEGELATFNVRIEGTPAQLGTFDGTFRGLLATQPIECDVGQDSKRVKCEDPRVMKIEADARQITYRFYDGQFNVFQNLGLALHEIGENGRGESREKYHEKHAGDTATAVVITITPAGTLSANCSAHVPPPCYTWNNCVQQTGTQCTRAAPPRCVPC
jgi:hypothetical protein